MLFLLSDFINQCSFSYDIKIYSEIAQQMRDYIVYNL